MRELYGRPAAVPRGWYLLPVIAFVWNQTVYNCSNLLVGNAPHYDCTTALDRITPFLPCSVLVYYFSFLYFAIVFLWIARRNRALAYRFFAADLLAKTICLPFFLLLPTTNVRPVVAGGSLWLDMVRLLYRMDAPTNLFPSIHCLLSWLCWLGVRDAPESTTGMKRAALLTAIAICASTLMTKQHVIIDVFGGIAAAELSYRLAESPRILRAYAGMADRITGFRRAQHCTRG